MDTDSKENDLNDDNNNEYVDNDTGGRQEDEDMWEVVRVISPDEEKVECGTEECSDPAVATWSPNTDPDFKFDLCKNCQDEQMGGYDNDRVVPNTNPTTTNNEEQVDDSDSEGEQEDNDLGSDGDGDGDGGTMQYLYTRLTKEEDELLWKQ